MPDPAREETLARIRAALGPRGPRQRDENPPSPRRAVEAILAGVNGRRGELIERFESELKRIGGMAYRAPDKASACEQLGSLARQRDVRRAVAWAGLDQEVLASLAGLEVYLDEKGGDPERLVQEAARADLGVTAVDYALADTGTLVLLSGEGRARSVSLLPPLHVAILDAEKILPGLDEFFGLYGFDDGSSVRRLNSAVTFITGPSRTADIELTLVVGVHGPQELHVILVGA
jgi:L-lactate dehydrogenase complex protein LldG